MKKYLLIAVICIAHPLIHANDAKHAPYLTKQMELGTLTTLCVISTYVGDKINNGLVDHAENKNEVYKRVKFHKNFDYNRNPTLKAWREKTGWILRNHLFNTTRRVVCHGVGFGALIIPATVAITSSMTMLVRYVNHLNCTGCYTNEKRT